MYVHNICLVTSMLHAIMLLGNKDFPEKENLCDIQLQTVLSIGGDAGSHVPELL